MRLAYTALLLALFAFYYSIPQLEIGDSRYTLAISDLLIRNGNVDLRPVVKVDKVLPFVENYQYLVRATDLPADVLAAAKRAGVTSFGKSDATGYYVGHEIALYVPGAAADIYNGNYPLPPLFPNWPSFVAAPVSLLTSAFGVPVYDGVMFHDDRNALYQRTLAAALAALTIVFFLCGGPMRRSRRPLAMALAAWLGAGVVGLEHKPRALVRHVRAAVLFCRAVRLRARLRRQAGDAPLAVDCLRRLLSLAFMMKPLYALPSSDAGPSR